MRTGRLRDIFVIQNPVTVPSAIGTPSEEWTDGGTVFGALLNLSVRDQFYGASAQIRASHRILVRWTGEISARSRLRLGERIFNVAAYRDPDGRRRVLELTVWEEAPQ